MPRLKFSKASLTQAEMNAVVETFRKSVSQDRKVAEAASLEIAQAIELPIRQVVLSGDTTKGIFTPYDMTADQVVRFPLDIIAPGQERDFYAYVMPDHGDIPFRRIESDYLMVPTYGIGNSIDATHRVVRDASWPIVARMIEVMEAGVRKKMSDDGWQTILAAAVDRNIRVNDPAAAAGQFTPRLVTLAKSFMRRNGGGNSTSLNRARLTDVYISPEGLDDVYAWGLDLIPDSVREKIYYSDVSGEGAIQVFNVLIHALDELGVDQEYQTYFTTTLGGSLEASDTELGVGLDLQREDSFVMPIKEDFKSYEDNTTHRQGIFSLYGRGEYGFAVLDSRRTILLSF